MTSPMVILAIGSLLGGGFLMLSNRLIDFLAPVVGTPPLSHGFFTPISDITLVLVILGAGLAWAIYGRREVPVTAPHGSPVTVAARKDLYGDALNESVLMRPGLWLMRLSVFADNQGIDGAVRSIAAMMGGSAGRLRKLQSGFVRSYALLMLAGAALVVGTLVLVRL
jgi:NADH-quinone oxidoreductase subunit L